ncbi:low molecular weight phosphatase family protein [Bizionia paragorgiae]|uniref:arsenate-mycothiol transferase ArsC n=1 Tax=Bizionia paragorgiae TaxID=283786 RepID=UPI003A957EC1
MKSLFPELDKHIIDFDDTTITDDRKKLLNPIIQDLQQKLTQKEAIRLNFICTHNSRRSHLAQIWGQTLAYYFGIPNVSCYSAGTEATALFPSVLKTLEDKGFQITTLSDGKNPIYSIKYGSNTPPIIGFSKTIDHSFNPKTDFIAIMTCSHADEGCPFIAGAERRFAFTFDDPKAFDNTSKAQEAYQNTSLQIANQLHYIFSKLKP